MTAARTNRLRDAIRAAAKHIGIVGCYHVAYTYSVSGGQSWASMTCAIAPWLHRENYPELVDYLKAEAAGASTTPAITSITKL